MNRAVEYYFRAKGLWEPVRLEGGGESDVKG